MVRFCFVELVAARCRLSEAREWVQIAHQRVAADVRRRSLRWLREVVRRETHEPWKENLVLRMVKPVGALRAVRVGALLERVRAHREADRGHWITGLEDRNAPVKERRRRPPRLHVVID